MRLRYPLGEFARDNDRPAGRFRRRRRNGDTRRHRRHLCRHRRSGLLRLAGDDSRLVPAVACCRRRPSVLSATAGVAAPPVATPVARAITASGLRFRDLSLGLGFAPSPADAVARRSRTGQPGRPVRDRLSRGRSRWGSAAGTGGGADKGTGAAATLAICGSGNFPVISAIRTHLVLGNFGQAIVGIQPTGASGAPNHCGGCSWNSPGPITPSTAKRQRRAKKMAVVKRYSAWLRHDSPAGKILRIDDRPGPRNPRHGPP